jgi:hypothetical protein
MDLTSAAIDRLQKLFHDGQRLHSVEGIASQRFYMGPEGTLVTVELPPPDRKWKAGSLDTLLTIAAEEIADLSEINSEEVLQQTKPAIWYSPERVIFLFGRDDSREQVTFDLQQSLAFRVIDQLAESCKGFRQIDLIRLIRRELRLVTGLDELLTSVRSLRFRTDSDVDRQNSTLGKSIESAASGTTNLPESVPIKLEAFTNLPEIGFAPLALDLMVEPDAESQQIGLMIAGDQLERETQGTLKRLRDFIVDELVARCSKSKDNITDYCGVYQGNR